MVGHLSATIQKEQYHCKVILKDTIKWMDNIKMDLREIGWDGVD
jgi:hypothetical protein